MGLFSFVGGLIGGGKKKKASRQADAAVIAALQKGVDTINAQGAEARKLNMPFLSAGTAALDQERDLLGLDGNAQQATAIGNLRKGALFNSLYDTGEESVLQNASATGGLRGGNTQRSLYELGEDTLTRVIEQQLSRLGGLRSGGQQTGAVLAGLGADQARSIADLFTGQGQQRAQGLLTRGGINAQNWQNAGNFIEDGIKTLISAGIF